MIGTYMFLNLFDFAADSNKFSALQVPLRYLQGTFVHLSA